MGPVVVALGMVVGLDYLKPRGLSRLAYGIPVFYLLWELGKARERGQVA